MLDHLYLIVTGAGTARRVPGILPQLAQLGPRLVVIPTPNAARVVSVREMMLALPPESPHRVVESYFDEAILPSPPFGLVLVAPCSFGSPARRRVVPARALDARSDPDAPLGQRLRRFLLPAFGSRMARRSARQH